MDELSDLFASVDAAQIADDVMEYGIIAGTALATGVAWSWASQKLLGLWPSAPSWVAQYAIPGLAIVGGAVGGSYIASKYNRRVGIGVGAGLAMAGVTQLAKQFFPSLPLNGINGLAGPEDEALLGLGNGQNAFNRYLASGMNGLGQATISVEDVTPGNGLGNATMTIEAMNGLGNVASAFA